MRKPSKNAKLIAARMTAVQSVYQMAMSGMDARSTYQDYVENRMGKEQEGDNYVPANLELLSKIILGVDEKRDVIRDMVLGALNGQKPEPLLQAILFCGIYELMAHSDVDAPVIINDYVNVTHGFFDQSEADLINAILDRQAKNLRV
jgi:transcription antitermination protein NusB